jgi:hypothetical protein
MNREVPTLYTWGYWGWGNATEQFVAAADAVEAGRGHAPPLFADVRIRRSVRATGFNGNRFGELLGGARHRWMPALGNRAILGGGGADIQIDRPEAAEELLDLALAGAAEGRRTLFFCACEWPRQDGRMSCHRAAVADLVLDAARRRRTAVQVVEWPGGEPGLLDLEVPPALARALARGSRKSIPLGREASHALHAGLAWGTIARVQHAGGELLLPVGPARYGAGEWYLPVLPLAAVGPSVDRLRDAVRDWRRASGLEPRTAA